MKNYSFTLHVSGIDTSRNYEDALFEAGCGDALVAVVNNTLYLDFDREASTFTEAVNSARENIEKAGGRVLEVTSLPS